MKSDTGTLPLAQGKVTHTSTPKQFIKHDMYNMLCVYVQNAACSTYTTDTQTHALACVFVCERAREIEGGKGGGGAEDFVEGIISRV